MKTLSDAAQTAIDKQYAGEPIRWLEIFWTDGTSSRHADKTIANWATGTILTLSEVAQTINYNGNLSTHEFSVELNDADGSLKNYMNTHDIHKKLVVLHQWFTGIPVTDSFELFRGQVYGPITWTEGGRTLSFTVLTPIYGREAGFSLEEGQFAYVPEQLTGKAWPFCFGSVLHVPCTIGADVATGTVGALFGIPDVTLPYKQKYIENEFANLIYAFGLFTQMEFNCHQATIDYDIVQQTIFFGTNKDSVFDYTITTSGVTSDKFSSASEVGSKITDFLKTATGYLVVLKDNLQKSPGAKFDINGVVVDFNTKSTNYLASIVVTGWPYPITVNSFAQDLTAPGATADSSQMVTCVVTQVALADGTINDYATLLNTVLARPNQLRLQYIAAIIAEDAAKQALEDLAKKLSDSVDIYYKYKQLQSVNPSATNLANLLAIQKSRDAVAEQVAEKNQDLYRASYDKEIAEIDIENLTSIFDMIGKIRAKQREIVDNYVDLHKSYVRILEMINRQADYLGNRTTINDYQQFSQGDNTVRINDLDIKGVLTNNSFQANTIVSRYTDIKIDQTQAADIDTFYIQDDLHLKGLYCRLPNNRIIKIIDQVDKQCRFTPVVTGDSTRNRSKEFILNGINADALKKGLGDLLSGNESPDQLEYLANTLPTDISGDSKARLRGIGNTQIISLQSDVPIVGTNSLFAMQPGVIAASGIKSGDGTDAKWFLVYDGNIVAIGGKNFTVYSSAQDIANIIYANTDLTAKDVTVTGGPLIDKSNNYAVGQFTITFIGSGKNYKSFSAIALLSDAATPWVYTPPKNWPIETHVVGLTTTSPNVNGAKEFTTKQRASKIKTVTDSTKYGAELNKLQSRIKQLTDAIVAVGNNANATVKLRAALLKDQNSFQALIAKVQIPKSVTEDAERIISEKEYKKIFQCELLQWMYFRRYVNAVGNNIPDPADQYYFTGRDITYITDAAGTIPAGWLTWLNSLDVATFMQEVDMVPECQAYVANVGDAVKKTGDWQQLQVVNLVPSTIRAVYAYKTVKGYRRLVPVPTTYYAKNQSLPYGTYLGVELNLTAISMRKPLSDYVDEQWEDTLYVSLDSSVGPNPIDVIQFLATNYTTLGVDATSFNNVRPLLANYPTNFAVLSKIDGLKLIEDIAFQSRCAVWVNAGILHINYLPLMPDSVKTITLDDILTDSFELSFTDTDALVTKSVNTYKVTYDQPKDYSLVLRTNLALYGEQRDDYNYFALTSRGLVNKSATYWMIQKGNTWKKVKFRGTLPLLVLEPFDTITLDLGRDYVSTDAVNCRVESVSYNSDANEVEVMLWVPIRSGEMSAFQFAWPSNLSVQDIFPQVQAMTSGNAGSGLGSTVPTGAPWDPFDNALEAFRPKDYGDVTPTDLADTEPTSPTEGLEETTAEIPNLDVFKPVELPPTKQEALADVDMGAPADKPSDGGELKNVFGQFDGVLDGINGARGNIINYSQTDTTTITVKVNGVDTDLTTVKYYWQIKSGTGSIVSAYFVNGLTGEFNTPPFIPPDTRVELHYDRDKHEFYFTIVNPEDLPRLGTQN